MLLARTGVLVILMMASAAMVNAQASAAPPQNLQRMRWYDAYDLGMKAVQAKQWPNAEAYLQQAKSAGPPQGRRVFYYGDTYKPFYPDYYLAIVYLNTNRQALAETAFGDVQRRNLIDPKERQSNELQQLARQATFERSMSDARQLIAKGDFTEAGKRATEAKSTNFDNGKADAIQQEITLLAKKPEPMPTPSGTPTPAPAETAPTPPIQQPVTVEAKNDPAVVPPTTSVIPPSSKPIYPTPTPRSNAISSAIGGPGGLLASAYVQVARAGLLAYFSGDYGEAVRQFETMPQAAAPARMRLFLACARAGVVLTGRGDTTLLRTARMEYRDAGGAQALAAQDRRFISPKILELLEKS